MKFPRPSQEEISVNLTPLIDVVFLLLIFFMVSTTFDNKTQLSGHVINANHRLIGHIGIRIDLQRQVGFFLPQFQQRGA